MTAFEVLAVVPLLLGCSVAGGYFVGFSTAVEDWRQVWRAREVAAVERYVAADDNPMFYRFGWRRLSSLVALKFWGAVTCGTCFGWHVAYLVLGSQAALAALTGGRPLVDWSTGVVAWGAACGAHTVVFKALASAGVLKED